MKAVVVHYHEIALKGRNRPRFTLKLVRNLQTACKGLSISQVKSLPGRVRMQLNDEKDWPELRSRIERVFGISNFSCSQSTSREMETLKTAILESLGSVRCASFRVLTRRADKTFSLTSQEINREIGAAVQQRYGFPVNLENPELTIYIELLPEEAFFYTEKFAGPGGLPVGISGRVAALISGGIDSPVAAHRMMKRGCQVVFVHFHSYPYLNKTSQEKVTELVQHLTRYQYASQLYLVPFGEMQREVVLGAPAPLRVVLYRRLMMRIAQELAGWAKAKALVTGESLGQVASQTLENLLVIEEASEIPILRPLIGMDKNEIIH
ncbi:MAG TPA: tRNA uracil 4-sulfurtransferase ThiI, partial [Nitrospiria bacterium]|nr:tRNA uracil 4-sulfurtransferase ThiI [Nitrospiria bacterium]